MAFRTFVRLSQEHEKADGSAFWVRHDQSQKSSRLFLGPVLAKPACSDRLATAERVPSTLRTAPLQTDASAVDIMSRRKAAGCRRNKSDRQFNRALLGAKRCGGGAEEASKVTVQMRLVTETRGGCDLGQ
jgi:hypothetical protein